MHAERKNTRDLLRGFHARSEQNIDSIPAKSEEKLEAIDEGIRKIDFIRGLALQEAGSNQHKIGIVCVLDELLADFSISLYLNCSALYVPARMSTRRGLELGLACLIMWDCPLQFIGWMEADEDLSFSEMLRTVTSDKYSKFLKSIFPENDVLNPIRAAQYQQLYRQLSNTVHGKFGDFKSVNPTRFTCDKELFTRNVDLLIDAQNLTIDALTFRFRLPV